MKVYTFQLPKVISGFARMCLQLIQKDPTSKSKKRKEKMPG